MASTDHAAPAATGTLPSPSPCGSSPSNVARYTIAPEAEDELVDVDVELALLGTAVVEVLESDVVGGEAAVLVWFAAVACAPSKRHRHSTTRKR